MLSVVSDVQNFKFTCLQLACLHSEAYSAKSAKRSKPDACAVEDKTCVDEDDDPDLKEVMDIARAQADSNGESSFMQAIAAGYAKDEYLESRAVAATTHNANFDIEAVVLEEGAYIMCG